MGAGGRAEAAEVARLRTNMQRTCAVGRGDVRVVGMASRRRGLQKRKRGR